MLLRRLYPETSSQTTSRQIKGIVIKETQYLAGFNSYSPDIQPSEQDIWQQVTREILRENASLWERLAKL
ncbi:MAG: hypothetical protein U9Q70_02610 [Chloroflexota bacterium]|nr:hypothetical protein [Chloroflexota bacterium]